MRLVWERDWHTWSLGLSVTFDRRAWELAIGVGPLVVGVQAP